MAVYEQTLRFSAENAVEYAAMRAHCARREAVDGKIHEYEATWDDDAMTVTLTFSNARSTGWTG